ncbi:shikimate kinase [Piscibacillus halophilus]|uniref:Shikimate kinase n=1 Tax=Piscibacillus halophilus TaxID=571933 RepID=A0A1H9ADW6_9BACI|nr:shikimate kinase [Piscibacillus halophilus]SEP74158.1 shikimate kinase [Piscibacillus halophilus]
MESIILIGFMGAGKSSVGKALSTELNIQFLDTDHIIERETNLSIPQIFELYGEGHFRKLEADVLKKVISQDQVISTGGGIVELEMNRQFLAQHSHTIFLKTNLQTIFKRLETDQSRPLWNQSYVKRLELFNKRQMYYEEAANIVVQTDYLSIENTVNKILSQLKL